jgi:hypothetical protein
MRALLVVAALALAAAGCVDAPAWGDQRRDAGATVRPADAGSANPLNASPPPPVLPRSPERACKKDSDCAFVERPCSCAPCGEYWREVMNRRELGKLQAHWNREGCRRVMCPMCVGTPLGKKAVCVAGQCAPR